MYNVWENYVIIDNVKSKIVKSSRLQWKLDTLIDKFFNQNLHKRSWTVRDILVEHLIDVLKNQNKYRVTLIIKIEGELYGVIYLARG